jgi:hypothetical protein
VIRAGGPRSVDITLPKPPDTPDDIADPTRLSPPEIARLIGGAAALARLPLRIFAFPWSVILEARGGATVAVSGSARTVLGFPTGADAVRESNRTFSLDFSGGSRLDLTVTAPGGPFTLRVDFVAPLIGDATDVSKPDITHILGRAIVDARLEGLLRVRNGFGVIVFTQGNGTTRMTGPVVERLRMNNPAGTVVGSREAGGELPPINLNTHNTLRIEVTEGATVRFDGDPADIPDLAHAQPQDVRRAINLACELAGVPARAEPATIGLRIAGSPADTLGPRANLGGAQLAELAASRAAVPAAGRPALFAPRTALGADTLARGITNRLYLRVANTGNVPATATRLRLFRVDTTPTVTATLIPGATATVTIPPDGATLGGPPFIHEFTWDPGGAVDRMQLVLAVADADLPGRRLDPPVFAAPAEVSAFAARNPSVALRSFSVVAP